LEDISLVPAAPAPYSSGHRRAQIVVLLLAICLILAIVMFAVDFREFGQLGRIAHRLPIAEADVMFTLRLVSALAIAWVLCYAATAGAFLFWIHRAHRNLTSLGSSDLEFTPKGAVGWYFFPFLNLFKPYQVMREIYNASAPTANENWNRLHQRAPAIVKCWWFFFLLMGLAGRATNISSGNDAVSLQISAAMGMVFDVIAIFAALLAACLIRSIDRRQTARASILATA
jgi:hypothetical protein